jgi:amidase
MNSIEEEEQINQLKQDLRRAARDILNDLFDKEKVNILAAPGDSPLCVHASAAGNSSSTAHLTRCC